MGSWRRLLLLLIGVAMAALPWCSVTQADVKEDISLRYEQGIAETLEALQESTSSLRDRDLSVLDSHELSEHLFLSMYLIYLGTIYYEHINREFPPSLEGLAGTEFIPEWPTNPLNNFEPVNVLSLDDVFSPGDIVLQVCPPEFYSVMKDPRPLSFELAVYGPDSEFALSGNAAPMKRNTWAAVPDGALYMIGAHTETAANMRLKWEKMQEKARKEGGQR